MIAPYLLINPSIDRDPHVCTREEIGKARESALQGREPRRVVAVHCAPCSTRQELKLSGELGRA